MAIKSFNQLEREAFQAVGGTGDSLQDLRMTYYGAKASSTAVSETDRERAFLKKMTGLTYDSLSDLWRAYFISKGMTEATSLGDMKRDFYENVKFQGDIEIDNIRVSESITMWTNRRDIDKVYDSVKVSESVTSLEKNLVKSLADGVNVSENVTATRV